MRRFRFTVALFVFVLIFPVFAWSQDLVVSTDWLQKNLKDPSLVIVDIRKVEEFKAGHIPGAVNLIYNSWAVNKDGYQNEVPAQDELFETMGKAGIKPDSRVVVVGKADSPVELANITRVAWTVKYAGVANVHILNGAQNLWVKQNKPVTKAAKAPAAVKYEGKVNPAMLAAKDYILKNLKNPKVIIVDTREVPFYTGEKKLPFVAKAGHIAGAKNLPNSKMYNADGTFKPKHELALVAAEMIGDQTDLGYVIYCDSGRFATGWLMMLADIGYVNSWTKKWPALYDGSMEEWTKDPDAPVETGAPAAK